MPSKAGAGLSQDVVGPVGVGVDPAPPFLPLGVESVLGSPLVLTVGRLKKWIRNVLGAPVGEALIDVVPMPKLFGKIAPWRAGGGDSKDGGAWHEGPDEGPLLVGQAVAICSHNDIAHLSQQPVNGKSILIIGAAVPSLPVAAMINGVAP